MNRIMNDEDITQTGGRPPELFRYDPNMQVTSMEDNMAAISYLEHNFPKLLKYPLQNNVKIVNMVGLNMNLKKWQAQCDMLEMKQNLIEFPRVKWEPNVLLCKCDITLPRSQPIVMNNVKKQIVLDLHRQLQLLWHGRDLGKVLMKWPFPYDRGKWMARIS